MAAFVATAVAQQSSTLPPSHNPRDQTYKWFGKKDKTDYEEGGRIIKGQVLDQGGTPARGAVVKLLSAADKKGRSAIVDSSGRFEFRDLKRDQDYVLTASTADAEVTRKISQYIAEKQVDLSLRLARKEASQPKQ